MQTLEADILARESRLRKLTIARDPALQMRAMSDRAVFDDPAVRARMLEIQQSTTHLREMLESIAAKRAALAELHRRGVAPAARRTPPVDRHNVEEAARTLMRFRQDRGAL